MRLWQRSLVICGGTVLAFYTLLPLALRSGSGAAVAAVLVGLVAGSNGLLYLALRCPSCRRWACRPPGNSRGTVWPGYECRHCGREY
jgi:hypothetical protein